MMKRNQSIKAEIGKLLKRADIEGVELQREYLRGAIRALKWVSTEGALSVSGKYDLERV